MASHTRSVLRPQGLHQGLLDDAFLHGQGELAGALLGSAPAHAVGQAGDVRDLVGLDPLALFRDGSRAVMGALLHRAHIFHFMGIVHIGTPFGFLLFRVRSPRNTNFFVHYIRKFPVLQGLCRNFNSKGLTFLTDPQSPARLFPGTGRGPGSWRRRGTGNRAPPAFPRHGPGPAPPGCPAGAETLSGPWCSR